jgi:hypothetical protein
MSPLSPHSAHLASSLVSLQQRWGVAPFGPLADGADDGGDDDDDDDGYGLLFGPAAGVGGELEPLPHATVSTSSANVSSAYF